MSPLDAARAYVAEEQPWCHVVRLLEDATDYLAVLELNEGEPEWPLGPGPVFVSKATGEVWSDAYGAVSDKIEAMQRVDWE